jgi:hypothetical protein
VGGTSSAVGVGTDVDRPADRELPRTPQADAGRRERDPSDQHAPVAVAAELLAGHEEQREQPPGDHPEVAHGMAEQRHAHVVTGERSCGQHGQQRRPQDDGRTVRPLIAVPQCEPATEQREGRDHPPARRPEG